MSIDLANWMSFASGSKRLSELTIPGTHDSGSTMQVGVPAEYGVRLKLSTQTRGLKAQLEGGIRFLDLRCANIDGVFHLYHEGYSFGLLFSTARDICRNFLAGHPGETIVVSIKEEYTNTKLEFAKVFEGYVKETPGLWFLANRIPALADARGKLVLFRRFSAVSSDAFPEHGINAFDGFKNNATFTIAGPPRLEIQDEYGIKSTPIASKQTAIEKHFKLALDKEHTDRDALYVNFTSAAGVIKRDFPIEAAVFINPAVRNYVTGKRGRLGIVPRDFDAIDFRSPSADSTVAQPDTVDLLNSILAETNFDYFFLQNQRDSDVVDFKDGAFGTNLIAYPRKKSDTGNQDMLFIVSDHPPYFVFANRQTGTVIDIDIDGAPAPGSPLVAAPRRPGRDTQLWMLVPSGEKDRYFITSKVKGAGVITVDTPRRPDGVTPLVVSPRGGTNPPNTQLWSIGRS